ncbi:hypothetical protein BDQ12DRAFT_646959 [Crucibulum laeve]|uniref:J domain-containing protein n=1 Tax=Crucibulum laeve TaxID=68775 RepID=A0A5C3M8W9_9AGAR|nr:hypothetical protein BDQ12DRAFT_646959 [Crucibulum laeve]
MTVASRFWRLLSPSLCISSPSPPAARNVFNRSIFSISRSPTLITTSFIRIPRTRRSIHQPTPVYDTTVPSICPSCSKPLLSSVPACTKCWTIFSLPGDLSYHHLLGLPYEPNPFVVDIPTLKKHFREAQSVCHPDSWVSKGNDKQQVAEALSARVNHAYQTLLNPLSRAEYILGHNHLPMSESDQVDDMEFMADIMEAREIIEDTEDIDEVTRMMEDTDSRMKQTVKEIESLVEKHSWSELKAAAIRLRYLEGIERAAKQWLDNH